MTVAHRYAGRASGASAHRLPRRRAPVQAPGIRLTRERPRPRHPRDQPRPDPRAIAAAGHAATSSGADGHRTRTPPTRCAGCARARSAAARRGCPGWLDSAPTLTEPQTRITGLALVGRYAVQPTWARWSRHRASTRSPCCASSARVRECTARPSRTGPRRSASRTGTRPGDRHSARPRRGTG